jgi:DNA-binding protein H-NS
MTKKTLAQIQSQIDKLQKEADAIRTREVADVVGRIKEAIAHYGLTAADLGLDGMTATRGPVRKASGRVKAMKQSARSAKAEKTDRPAKPAKPAKAAKAAKSGRVSVIKFADDEGHTWTGVGKRPNWYLAALASGKTAEDLLVAKAA